MKKEEKKLEEKHLTHNCKAFLDVKKVSEILAVLKDVPKWYQACVSSDDTDNKSLNIKGILINNNPGNRHIEFIVEGDLRPYHAGAVYRPYVKEKK